MSTIFIAAKMSYSKLLKLTDILTKRFPQDEVVLKLKNKYSVVTANSYTTYDKNPYIINKVINSIKILIVDPQDAKKFTNPAFKTVKALITGYSEQKCEYDPQSMTFFWQSYPDFHSNNAIVLEKGVVYKFGEASWDTVASYFVNYLASHLEKQGKKNDSPFSF